MGIWMAVVLSAAGFCQETSDYRRPSDPDENRKAVEAVAIARLGVWAGREFKFEAIRTDGLIAASKQEALFSASAMGGLEFYDHVVVLAMIEGDEAAKLTAELAGVYAGWHERPRERYGKGVPDEVTVYAGVVGGSLSVHEPNFGDFKGGVGFGGGMSFGWTLTSHLSVELSAEYRSLKFDYKRDVTSGDTSIGGNSAVIGVGIDLRF
jgi:hypothetical protein